MNSEINPQYFYVIMPLDSDSESGKKVNVIREIAGEYGYIAYFPDYKKNAQDFDLRATIKDFRNTSFVLADLSKERPSCYYELGIAEAIGAKVYIVASEGTDIHQTSHRTDIYFYKDYEQLGKIVSYILTSEMRGL